MKIPLNFTKMEASYRMNNYEVQSSSRIVVSGSQNYQSSLHTQENRDHDLLN